MFRGGIIIASIGGLALVAWGLAKFERDLDEAFGDWPAIPEGFVVAAAHELKLGEGASCASSGRGSHKVISHMTMGGL
jgi:hypothetical protein